MEEFDGYPYSSFNDFFIRRFKEGKRNFPAEREILPAFAEARYLFFEQVKPEQGFPVKGIFLSPTQLLGNEEKARSFEGGALMIARLCPTDYHRYHYPDDGVTSESYPVRGRLHSVNPLALLYRNEIFATNERRVSLLETRNFGRLAYIEVGALCVGRIVQVHREELPFHRGQEKGYFLFGGSTVILLSEPGKMRFDSDLLEETRNGREVLLRLGERIAVAMAPNCH